MRAWLEARWYGGAPVPVWLGALEQVYRGILRGRRTLYRCGLVRTRHPGVPVVVVGNVVVGGTGKTPVVIALADLLAQRGLRVGVVSRGHGRRGRRLRWVEPGEDVRRTGDEPMEIRLATGCPVVVAADRARAASALAASGRVDLILSDDGLQHWRLARDFEIVLVDAALGFGNGRLLPAGPLREGSERIAAADAVLVRDGEGPQAFRIEPVCFRRVGTGAAAPLDAFSGVEAAAAAAIAHPQRFFATLEALGVRLIRRHALPDHAAFPPSVLETGGLPLLVTRKDAVKLHTAQLPGGSEIWYLETRARLPAALLDTLLRRIGRIP